MAVVSVKEIWSGRDGEFSDDYQRRYTRTFEVETDDTADSAAVVGFAATIPRLQSPYVSYATGETDPLARCRRVRPRQDPDNPFLWEVACEYDTRSTEPTSDADPGQPGSGGQADEPTLRPWEVEWDYEEWTQPVRRGVTDPAADVPAFGAAPANVVGDIFDPLPEFRTGCAVLVVTRYEAAFGREKATTYAFTLNKLAYLGAAPGTAQMLPIRAVREWIGGAEFWKVTYRIRFQPPGTYTAVTDVGVIQTSPNTWQPAVLNAGYREFVVVGGVGVGFRQPTAILDGLSQQPVTQPVPLDQFGHAMTPDEVASGVYYRTVNAYRLVDWTSLNLNV